LQWPRSYKAAAEEYHSDRGRSSARRRLGRADLFLYKEETKEQKEPEREQVQARVKEKEKAQVQEPVQAEEKQRRHWVAKE
jgi:hypothetical protein